jgi:hypothetical protein
MRRQGRQDRAGQGRAGQESCCLGIHGRAIAGMMIASF